MIWKTICGWGAYEVSDTGLVRSKSRLVNTKGGGLKPVPSVVLRAALDHGGHPRVCLVDGKRKKNFWVHRLVLEAFVGPRLGGMVACHNNGIPSDNGVSNLRWDTLKSNQLDRHFHGTSRTRLTAEQVYEIRRSSEPIRALAARFGVGANTIRYARNGVSWKHIPGREEVMR